MAKLWESKKERKKYIENLYQQMRDAYGPDCQIDFPGKYADLGESGLRWYRVAEAIVRDWEKEVQKAEKSAKRENRRMERSASRQEERQRKALVKSLYNEKLEGTAYRPQDKAKALAEAQAEALDLVEPVDFEYVDWEDILDKKPTIESIMAEYPIEKPEEASEGITVEDYITENADDLVDEDVTESEDVAESEDALETAPTEEEVLDEKPEYVDEDDDDKGYEDGEERVISK